MLIYDRPMDPLLVLTIGQAPRLDIEAELTDVLPDRPIEMRGALDGLSIDEVRQLSPISSDDVLHTRLPSGHDVAVSKKAVSDRLSVKIEEAGDRPTLVACTGPFPELTRRPNLLFPSVVLDGLIEAVLPPGSRLGVLVPLPEQVELVTRTRSRPDRPTTVVAVLPGHDPSQATATLTEAGVDLVVLDCFGYDRTLLDIVRRLTGRPVLSAVRASAHLAGELLG